jgi:hypothetical protein
MVEIWNSLAGVTPVTKFANRKVGTERIWRAIQSLGEVAAAPVPEAPADAPEVETPFDEAPAAESNQEQAEAEPLESAAAQATETADQPEQPTVSEPVATVGAQAPDVAPAAADPTKDATPKKKAPKAKKAPKPAKTETGPREGSKTAQVVAMLKREGGATITEIMSTMSWQKHTVRGFMAGAMKKAGYTVESFKPEGGERSYRING